MWSPMKDSMPQFQESPSCFSQVLACHDDPDSVLMRSCDEAALNSARWHLGFGV